MQMERPFTKTVLLVMTVVMIHLFTSCKGPQKTSTVKEEKKTTQHQKIDRLYLKEGFIDNETYRVVIVTAKDDCGKEESEIRRQAKKRSYSRLIDLLLSNDRKVTSNTRASITRLVEYNGNFIPKRVDCPGSRLYYYEVKRDNLKRYLMNISEPR